MTSTETTIGMESITTKKGRIAIALSATAGGPRVRLVAATQEVRAKGRRCTVKACRAEVAAAVPRVTATSKCREEVEAAATTATAAPRQNAPILPMMAPTTKSMSRGIPTAAMRTTFVSTSGRLAPSKKS